MRDRLRSLLLFSDLDDTQLDLLAGCAREIRVTAGQPLIQRGDPGSGIFVLEEGRALVEAPEGTRELGPGDIFGERSMLNDTERTARVLEEGRALVEAPEGTRELGPGDIFGERSMLNDTERTARVLAQTNVRCIAIPRPELEQVIAANPQLGERLRHVSA